MATPTRRGARHLRARLRAKGQVTLPPTVREALHIDEGDDVSFEVTDNGQVVLTGLRSMPADQAWYWTPEWQAGEQEADRELATGQGIVHKDAGSMFDDLGL